MINKVHQEVDNLLLALCGRRQNNFTQELSEGKKVPLTHDQVASYVAALSQHMSYVPVQSIVYYIFKLAITIFSYTVDLFASPETEQSHMVCSKNSMHPSCEENDLVHTGKGTCKWCVVSGSHFWRY